MNAEQEEEVEVLQSIYDGDSAFKQTGDTTFQYKYGEDGAVTSAVLEIQWTTLYPAQLPNIHLDAFYNNHLKSRVKEQIVEKLKEEADSNLGMPMTYLLIQWGLDNIPDLLESALKSGDILDPQSMKQDREPSPANNVGGNDGDAPGKKANQLTKSQKRKEWDRVDNKGERPRGHDWVDIIKHLSQTGPVSLPPPPVTPTPNPNAGDAAQL